MALPGAEPAAASSQSWDLRRPRLAPWSTRVSLCFVKLPHQRARASQDRGIPLASRAANELPLQAAQVVTVRAPHARHSAGAQRRAVPGASSGETLPLKAADEEALQASKERQELFDSISPVYDLLNDALSLGLHRVWKRMTVAWSGARPGDRAVDLCCGSGDIALLLAEKVGPSGQVVGLDYARDQLAVARTKEKAAWRPGCTPVEWVWGDAQDLPFEGESVDAVTMGYGLRNVTDMDLALREVHRILKPGKSCAILDFNNSEDETVSSVQTFMLNNVVVPVASQLGVAAQYEYLEGSIARFPRGRALEQMARRAGFSRAVHYETGFGLMGILVARK